MASSSDVAKIGRRIRRRRLFLEMTQGELAGRTGVSQPVISRIEQGTIWDMEILNRVISELGGRFTVKVMWEE